MGHAVKSKARNASQRIVAFDVIRGLFLVIILINHIELYPSGFDYFTGRGRLFVSAAEGFFFMSGLLVGLVYRRRLAHGIKFIFRKMWTRALELYIGSVTLSLLFTATALYLNHPNLKQGLDTFSSGRHIIEQTFSMTYNFGWADFLDRFALMMLAAPLGFYLLVRRKWQWLALASLVIWAAPGNNNPWDTLNWQIFFFVGMILGFHWNELTTRWHGLVASRQKLIKRTVIYLSAVTFAMSYASVYVLSVLNEHINSLPGWLQHFTLHWNSANYSVWNYAQKWTVGPIRIVLFFLWFAALFMLVNKYLSTIRRLSRGWLELLGTNSLFVYIAHAFIVFGFKFFIPSHTNLGENFLITAAALACLIWVTSAYKRYHPTLRSRKTHLYQKLPWVPANVES